MKKGDYVRTDYGISKIIGIFPEGTFVFIETNNGLGNGSSIQNGKLRKGIVVLEVDYRNFIDNNVKEKPIDLIEVGDYVNGSLVLSIYNEPYGREEKVLRIERTICKGSAFGDENETVYNNEIKSIVTKEQFESMEYRIGDEENGNSRNR